jgi:hypothetical protein
MVGLRHCERELQAFSIEGPWYRKRDRRPRSSPFSLARRAAWRAMSGRIDRSTLPEKLSEARRDISK